MLWKTFDMTNMSYSQSMNISTPLRPDLTSSTQCLVYIENTRAFADVDGITHIARVVRSFIREDTLIYELQLLTDSEGDAIFDLREVTVLADAIVSDRDLRDINPKWIYHFVSPLPGENKEVRYPIRASSFVIKDAADRPLERTSRSALGSGIYGRYISDASRLTSFLIDPSQSAYRIDCPNSYLVQDKEHGQSITLASLLTNRYLDRIIQAVGATMGEEEILELIQMNSIHNLATLWNIVFYRTQDFISQSDLELILSQYLSTYFTDNTLLDSITGVPIQELPINHIMRSLGYEGILGDDADTNGWGRGCVSYNYQQADILTGDLARYQKN